MKNTKYICTTCGSEMVFRILNVGRLPGQIGCSQKECNGLSVELNGSADNNSEPKGVFFRPETKTDWLAIKAQLKFEAKKNEMFKKKTVKESNKEILKLLRQLQESVKSGNLLFLPIAYFSESKTD